MKRKENMKMKKLSEAQIRKASATRVAKELEEYNKWRRGQGKYERAGVPIRISCRELGIYIDRAIELLLTKKAKKTSPTPLQV